MCVECDVHFLNSFLLLSAVVESVWTQIMDVDGVCMEDYAVELPTSAPHLQEWTTITYWCIQKCTCSLDKYICV